jgi:GT2 family glycosyltransferase
MPAKVAVGCIVRDRAWILPEYLHALNHITYANKMYLFLENDSRDNTLEILQSTPFDAPKIIHSLQTGCPYGERINRSANNFSNLAYVRNQFIELFLQTNADYLLSVDSDIIVPPELLIKLMREKENTIVGAAISNIPNVPLDGRTPGNFQIECNGWFIHPPFYPLEEPMDVDVIGAVYLIPRKALAEGIRYGPHLLGEDLPFCLQAKAKGYRMRVLLDVICEHRMNE